MSAVVSAATTLLVQASDPNQDSFAQLVNNHMIQPGARVAQLVVLLLAMFDAMGSAASHHQEHWMQAIIRPVGLGVSGIVVIEVLKLAANAVLAGTVGF